MLALADPPHTQPGGGVFEAGDGAWHRAQETSERAWLDAYMRWTLKYGRRPLHGLGGTR